MNRRHIITLVVVVLGVYLILLNAPFLYTDIDIIVKNESIHNLSNFFKLFTKDYYNITKETALRPVLSIMHMLNYSIWRGNPLGFRIVEIVLYSLVVICFYITGRKLLNNDSAAFISALIFTVHPIHSDTLGCIVLAYGEMLYGLFMMVSFLYYLKVLKNYNRVYIYLIYFFWLLALFSKETAIVFPIIVLSHLFLFKGLDSKKTVDITVGFLVILCLYVIVRFFIFYLPEGRYVGYIKGSFYINVLTMTYVFLQYLILLVFPLKLAVEYYPDFIYTVFSIKFICGTLSVISVTVISYLLIKKKKYLLFVILMWIILPLLPVMNIIPFLKASLLNPRYLFVPTMGFCWMLGYLCVQQGKNARAFKISLILLVIFYSAKTIIRNYEWTDEIRLWRKNVEMYPNFSRPRNNLAAAYYKKGLTEKALNEFKTVISIEPENPMPYYNIGIIKKSKGDYQGAITEYKKAYEIIRHYPKDAPRSLSIVNDVLFALGNIYDGIGDEKTALKYYREASWEKQYLANKTYKHAVLDIKNKEYDNAALKLVKVLEYDPGHLNAYLQLAFTYNNMKRYAESVILLEKAISEGQESYLIYFQIAWAYSKKGETEKAISYYIKGLKYDKNNIRMLSELAKLYSGEKKYRNAVSIYQKIIKLDTKTVNYYNYLAQCYLNMNNFEKAEKTMEQALQIAPENKTAVSNYNYIKKIIEGTVK